jgi:tetratricopeptide (TPR) repeat protein
MDEDSGQTREGAVLGTPSYMAPEQARGKVQEIGPAVDVWALGIILYEMLTGQVPFRGSSLMETLDQVQHEEAVPPARLARGVPRDLETICLKCLHKEPARRYESAGELAEDLRRFLAHEPIRARPVGLAERLALWARRRPTAAALVGVSVLATLALLALATWSYHNLREANSALRAARDRAEARSRLARRAIDDMYTQVAEQWLGDEPHRDALQQDFLDKAARLYEELARDESDDPELRRETAQAWFRLGQIYNRQLGRYSEAEAAYGRALELQRGLVASSAEPRLSLDLARTCTWMGELLRTAGRPDDARPWYEEALGLQRDLASRCPDPVCRQEQARSLYNLGLACYDSGRPAAALEHLDQARALLAGVVQAGDPPADLEQDLARVQINRGAVLRRLQQPEPAREALQEAVGRLQRLRDAFPIKPEYRKELAIARNNLGNLLASTDPAQAQLHHGKARELLQKLADDFPARPIFRKELANTCNSLAASLASTDPDRATSLWEESFELFRHLAQRWPDQADYQSGAAMTLVNLGWLQLTARKAVAPACTLFQQAAPYLDAARDLNPNHPTYRSARLAWCEFLGQAQLKLGEHREASILAEQLVKEAVDPDRERLTAARLLAGCVSASDAAVDPPAVREQRSRTYAERALALLRQADPKRSRLAQPLDVAPDFEPLRKYPDFPRVAAWWAERANR